MLYFYMMKLFAGYLKKILELNITVPDHCHLTGNFRGLAAIECKIEILLKSALIVPLVSQSFSAHDCNLNFETLKIIAMGKNLWQKEKFFFAKSTEN